MTHTFCRFCGIDADHIVVLPFTPKEKQDESPYACVPCAIEHGYYCTKHDKPMTGSTHDHPFCIECIEEDVNEHRAEAERIADRIQESISPEEMDLIMEAIEISSIITGDSKVISLLRMVVTLAHRKRIPFDEALKLATSEWAVENLLVDRPIS